MKHVLVVEDDQWLGDSYERLLRQADFLVTRAKDAEVAMRAIEEQAVDVIVADVMLEGHTVFALLHELQSYDDTKLIPVVLSSNLPTEAFGKADLQQYGIVTVFDKATITPALLVAAVNEAGE